MRVANNAARRILLPQLILTEVVDDTNPEGRREEKSLVPYFARPLKATDQAGKARRPRWAPHEFNLFPIVLNGSGAPWAEAVLYILASLEGQVAPRMATYASMADDLAAFRRFLDSEEIDWTDFPAQKLSRPTYRYNGHLKHCVAASELSQSTARRRMGAVIGFYRWVSSENLMVFDHDPWKESDRYVRFTDGFGFPMSKRVKTTDVSIRVAQQRDPYDGCINDGGKLRPLSVTAQEWLVEALTSLGNTEMMLIHLLSLLTGARIQTVLTFRVKHALHVPDQSVWGNVRLPIGPGTGIDTKFDKKLVLHIPFWFCRLLQVYVQSERASEVGREFRIRTIAG